MGYHFREQEPIGPSDQSRRLILMAMLSGVAATVPVTARAQTTPDEQRLDTCIQELREVLQRMHPQSSVQHAYYLRSGEDGSWRFSMQGDVTYGEYEGEGLYELAVDGYLMTFWLEKDCHRSLSTGLPLPGMTFYHATQWHEGEFVDGVRRISQPNIVRKMSLATQISR